MTRNNFDIFNILGEGSGLRFFEIGRTSSELISASNNRPISKNRGPDPGIVDPVLFSIFDNFEK